MTFTAKESPTGKLIENANDVFDSFRDIGNADQESYWIVGLNQNRKEIFRKCLFLGTTISVNVDRKILFRRLLGSGACSWIDIHNHPTGDPTPSGADLQCVSDLESISKLLGLHFFDSVIIGDDDFFSFAYEGLLPGKVPNKKAVHQQKRHTRKRKATRNKRSYKANSDPFSAHLRSYLALKNPYPDALLFFNMGGSYEMFYDDAKVASRILNIPLATQGPYKGASIPFCAVPIHLAESSIGKLVCSGWKVAVCEKVSESEKKEKKPIHHLIIPGSLDGTEKTAAGKDQGNVGQGK